MHPRTMLAVGIVAALVAAGVVALPGLGADDLPSFEAQADFPDTIDGVPFDQAPPRAVITVDRTALAALVADGDGSAMVGTASVGDADGDSDGDSDGGSDGGSDGDSDGGSVRARTLSGTEQELDADSLTASDRALLESLGMLQAGAQHPDGDVTPDAGPEPEPRIDDDTAASLLEALVVDHLDVEVEVTSIIDDWFAVTGAAPADVLALDVVMTAEEPVLGMIFGDPTDEPRFVEQWALHNTGQQVGGQVGGVGVDIDWLEAFPEATGAGVTVAVIDTPFDTTHPDLAGAWVDGYNFVDGNTSVSNTTSAAHHGTHVAGTIAARINGTGIAGVSPGVSIMPLVVAADGTTAFTMDRVAQAIRFAVDKGADVINASLGTAPMAEWPQNDSFGGLREAVAYARDRGVPIVAAAGNLAADIDHNPVFPASYAYDGNLDNVIAVGALDNQGAMWVGSNVGSNYGARTVGIAAPGVRIIAPLAGGVYGQYTGTSMAAPHVAGVAALVLQRDADLTAAGAVERIVDRGVTLTSWIGRSTSGNRLSAAGSLGVASEPLVAFSGLSGQVAVDASTADITTTLNVATPPDGIPITAATVTLAMHMDGQMYAVVQQPVAVSATVTEDGEEQPTGDGDDGAVDGAVDGQVDGAVDGQVAGTTHLETDSEGALAATLGDGVVTLSLHLPVGDYAWIVEFDDNEELGVYLGAFRISQATAPSSGGGSTPPPDGGGSPTPTDDSPESSPPPDSDGSAPPPDDSSPTPPPPDSGGTTPPPPDSGGTTPPPPDADGSPAPADDTGSTPPADGGGTTPTDGDGSTQPPDGDGSTQPPDSPSSSPPPDDGGSAPPPDSSPGAPSPTDAEPVTPPADDDSSPSPGSGGSSPAPDDTSSSPPPDDDTTSTTGSRIRPSEGSADTLVDIRGSWPADAQVRFGDQPAYVSFRGSSFLTVKAPAMASAGPVDVVVRDSSGDVIEAFPGGFTYLEGSGGTTTPGDGSTTPPSDGSTTPPPGDGGTSPPPGDGGTTPPPDDGSTSPPPDDGSTSPPPGDGGTTPPPDDGSTSPPPGGGTTPPPDDGASDGPGPRTVGGVQSLGNGLSVVQLGSGHPGSEAPSQLWPPACVTSCPAVRVLG